MLGRNYIHELTYVTALCVIEMSFNRYKNRVTPIFPASTHSVMLDKIVVSSEEENYSASSRLCGNPKRKRRAYELQKLFFDF
jgi:hypothetical protein